MHCGITVTKRKFEPAEGMEYRDPDVASDDGAGDGKLPMDCY
jgi:hypothetical protein